MAHTVVISSTVHDTVSDSITIKGTIDGEPYTIAMLLSELTSEPSVLSAQTLIANSVVSRTIPPQIVPVTLTTWNGTIVV